MSALLRSSIALALVWMIYVGYAAWAVPWIEPPLEQRPERPAATQTTSTLPSAVDRQQLAELGQWFQADDWELDSPKVLQTPQGYLLFKSYEILPDKRVRLAPCSMVMLARRVGDESQRRRQAVILRAPQGAELRFTEQFDLRRANLGKLQGGALQGPIKIHSDMRTAGPEDDLVVETRDVKLVESRVETPHEINFRLGRSIGRGRGLKIELRQGAAAEGAPAFDGLRALQVLQDVELTLVQEPREPSPAEPRAEPSGIAAGLFGGAAPPPLRVVCKGPFTFDLENRVATFEKEVTGRTLVDGPPDELSAEILSVHFESNAPGDPAKKLSGLEPVMLELEGKPAWINAPSRQARAHGNRLRYHLKTLRADLWGQPEASAVQGGSELHGAELHFAGGPNGTWGELRSDQPGWVRSVDPTDATRVFEARWLKRIEFRPHEGKQLLKVEGQAKLIMPGAGGLEGEQIYALLVPESAPGETAGGVGGGLAPERLFAQGDVAIDSPQLSGRLQRLELWFEPDEPQAASPRRRRFEYASFDPVRRGPHELLLTSYVEPAARDPVAPWPAAPRPAPPVAAAPTQKLSLTAARLHGRIRRTRPQPQIIELVVDTNVRLTSAPVATPQAPTLVMTGDTARITSAEQGAVAAVLQGRPANVYAQEMQLSGERIYLDQAQNRVWLDRPGIIRVQVLRDLQGQPLAKPDIAELTWQGTMDFDGLTARFTKRVAAVMQGQELRTEQMDARFVERVDFANVAPGSRPAASGAAQLDAIVCREGVEFNGRTLDPQGRLLSVERIVAQDLSLLQRTGALNARGPGWMSQVRRGAPPGLALPGGSTPSAPAAADSALSYLRVEFQREIRGNTQRREMSFTHLVTAVFGPVASWDDTLNTDDDVDRLGTRGGRLECDELRVVQMSPGAADPSMELQAIGNTRIEGAGLNARAAKLTYTQAKDLLVLEGDGRSAAQLWWQPSPGAAPSTNAAQRLLFWRSTGQVKQEGGMLLDLTIAPSGPTAVPAPR